MGGKLFLSPLARIVRVLFLLLFVFLVALLVLLVLGAFNLIPGFLEGTYAALFGFIEGVQGVWRVVLTLVTLSLSVYGWLKVKSEIVATNEATVRALFYGYQKAFLEKIREAYRGQPYVCLVGEPSQEILENPDYIASVKKELAALGFSLQVVKGKAPDLREVVTVLERKAKGRTRLILFDVPTTLRTLKRIIEYAIATRPREFFEKQQDALYAERAREFFAAFDRWAASEAPPGCFVRVGGEGRDAGALARAIAAKIREIQSPKGG
jgi:hypothetical protein